MTMERMESKNIINLVPVIKTYNREKVCSCYNTMDIVCHGNYPAYEVDLVNREIHCQRCGALVDPIEAFKNLAMYYEEINRWVDSMREETKILQAYKPWKRALKEIEHNIGRKGDHLPICPNCGKSFELTDIRGYASRE